MKRLRRVLCPVDLRQPSHGALGFAALVAETFESVLDAIYVPEGHDARTTRLFAPRVHAVEKLMTTHNLGEDLASLVRACAPCVRSTAEIRWGRPLRSVLAEASRRRSDLIVVGGLGQASSWRCTARFSDALASEASCPVLTVPAADSAPRPSRILLAVDFSEATDTAVEWTASLGSHFGANVEVLHADRGLAGAPSELGTIESRFGRSGVPATIRAASGASVLADVAGRSADGSFDLVVIGVERAGRFDGAFVERLRKLVRTPVLSIVAKAERQPLLSPDALAGLREMLPAGLAPQAHSSAAVARTLGVRMPSTAARTACS